MFAMSEECTSCDGRLRGKIAVLLAVAGCSSQRMFVVDTCVLHIEGLFLVCGFRARCDVRSRCSEQVCEEWQRIAGEVQLLIVLDGPPKETRVYHILASRCTFSCIVVDVCDSLSLKRGNLSCLKLLQVFLDCGIDYCISEV